MPIERINKCRSTRRRRNNVQAVRKESAKARRRQAGNG